MKNMELINFFFRKNLAERKQKQCEEAWDEEIPEEKNFKPNQMAAKEVTHCLRPAQTF